MKISISNLNCDLTAEQCKAAKGGHVYSSFLPLFRCTRRPVHFGFYNARLVARLPFTNLGLCVRQSLRLGFNNV